MENEKYLKLARMAREEGNSEDAKTYYNKIREEDPENGEAKFFYAYYSLYEGKNGELPQRFNNVCKAVFSAIKLIKNSDIAKDEQYMAIAEIVRAFLPMTWSLNKYMNQKNQETRVGDSNVKVFDAREISSCCSKGMFAIRDLGNELESISDGDSQFMKLAVSVWKEYVSLAQKWYAYPPKGEAEIYAEKIKKYEPTYVMPQRAGCLSYAYKKE